MRNVSDKNCVKIEKLIYIEYFFPDSRAVYEIMWKNMVQP